MATQSTRVVTATRNAVIPKRIVVGFDERGLADSAVEAAFGLSKTLGASLELVHAVPVTPRYWPGLAATASMERSEQLLRSAREAALDHAREIMKRLPESGQQPEQLLRVIEGRPADVLLAEARSESELVVLGGQRPAGALHFGGTLRTLLAKAKGPLWIQPHRAKFFRDILVPIDMSANSLHALALAAAFARKLRARVSVLHVFQVAYPVASTWPEVAMWTPAPSVDEMCAAAKVQFEQALAGIDWLGVEHEEIFTQGEPSSAILEHLKRHDLIALGTHGHSGFAAAVLGSVAWRVIEGCEKPALVARLDGRLPAA